MAKPQAKSFRSLVTGGDPDQIFPDVPADAEFEKADSEFLDASELEKIALAIIEHHGGFGHLDDMKIVYLWKRKGGSKLGKPTLGVCRRPTGLLAKFCNADFIIWLAANHHRDFRSTRWQIEATLFHELSHTDKDDEEPRLAPHDYEGFCREVELYGVWRPDLEKAANAFKQLKLV
jgi:hypothetical protein